MSGHQSSSAAEARSAICGRLQTCFERGAKLADERSFDYAQQMFGQCVAQDPANVAYVEAMLANLVHKFAKEPRRRAALAWGGGPLGKALKRQDWTQALRLGIDRLASDPWDVHALRAMATTCAALRHNEAELVYLKRALDAAPKDADVVRHCARSLARVGQLDQAIACWHRVETLAPGDKEATRMVFELNEKKLRLTIASRNGTAAPNLAAASAADTEPAVDADSAAEASENIKEVVLTPSQRLERAISDDPTNIQNYLDLAELLAEDKRFEEAERVLERCLAACGDDPRILERLDIVRQRCLEFIERRNAQPVAEKRPLRIPWLEAACVASLVALVLQLMPGVTKAVAHVVLVHWHIMLIIMNVLVLAVLVWLRGDTSRPSRN